MDRPDYLTEAQIIEAKARIAAKRKAKPGRNDEAPAGQPNWTVALIRASGIEPEPISWLWRDWLARGKMHIIAGQPGAGKTTIALKIAAAVSAGSRWPDGGSAKQGTL
jgi:superfamily II DNA or RNA helicase